MIDQLSASELSQQLMKPEGDTGRAIALALNESNKSLYDLVWNHLNLEPGQTVLEIGFGNGKHFPRYFESEPDLLITGVDFSEDMCREAIANNPELITANNARPEATDRPKLQILNADTFSLPLEANSVDRIVGINILYFWNPPEPHLAELHRVLKPGGYLLLGYRPRHVVEHLPFTRENFTLYESDELETLLANHRFEQVGGESHTFTMTWQDNDEQITDCCMVVRKAST